MKRSFFSCLLLLALIFFSAEILSTNASAQSALDFLNQNKKAPPATPDQINEAFTIYDECQSSDMVNRFYDCECLSSNFLELRRRQPKEQVINLLPAARKNCANTVSIAGDSYQYCLSWATPLRNDYDRYCKCYAKAYANNFRQSPSDSIRGREVLMTSALSSCNTGTEIAEKNALQNLMLLLKKQGLYKFLFPGAPSVTPNATPGQQQTQP